MSSVRDSILQAQLMKKEIQQMNNELLLCDLNLRIIKKTYDKLLMKDKPVGTSISAIYYHKKFK